MYQDSVVVASPGPPLVMIAITSKAWKLPMIEVITTKKVTGESSGKVILRKIVHGPA